MFQIDLKSRKPIYEQIVENFKTLIITGILKQDDRAPPIRELSKQLTVNPNTIQKAYRELENQAYFYTVPGRGTFIAAPPSTSERKPITALYENIRQSTLELLFRGETINDITNFISQIKNEKTKI